MAVTVANILNNPNFKRFSVVATADADVAAVIPHTFGVVPGLVTLEPGGRTAAGAAAAQVSAWAIGVVDATNVNMVATNGVGSGDAAIQLIVTVWLPHSIFQ